MEDLLVWGIPLVALVGAILVAVKKFAPGFSENAEKAIGMALVAGGVFFIQVLPGLEAAYPVVMMYVQWGVMALAAALLWGGFWPIARARIAAAQAPVWKPR